MIKQTFWSCLTILDGILSWNSLISLSCNVNTQCAHWYCYYHSQDIEMRFLKTVFLFGSSTSMLFSQWASLFLTLGPHCPPTGRLWVCIVNAYMVRNAVLCNVTLWGGIRRKMNLINLILDPKAAYNNGECFLFSLVQLFYQIIIVLCTLGSG